ncbi:hypothetical protein AC579_6109 [Pseudocercospora musae]|uniref:Uncharacterized protein n=1 Tax=Pseudocercospora musae TaxID=113226 RepID=A0A139I1T7_9PEZI|nr:hypothetical protein AC579_6109 [Pseudocercospora musae]
MAIYGGEALADERLPSRRAKTPLFFPPPATLEVLEPNAFCNPQSSNDLHVTGHTVGQAKRANRLNGEQHTAECWNKTRGTIDDPG